MQASFPLGSKRKIQDLCVAKTRAWSLNVPYAKEIFKKHGLTCEGWCLLKWGHAIKCMRMCICIHIGKRNLFTGADCGTRPQILMHLLSHAIVILHMCWAPLWALCSHLLGSGRCELDKMALIFFPYEQWNSQENLGGLSVFMIFCLYTPIYLAGRKRK